MKLKTLAAALAVGFGAAAFAPVSYTHLDVYKRQGQQTAFGQRNFKTGPQLSMSNDGWDGYAPARSRFLASMQRHQLANPVLLGGDVHANWVGHVKADYARPESAAIGVEFCGTSISSNGGINDKLADQLQENPHFVFADRERRGYGVVTFLSLIHI